MKTSGRRAERLVQEQVLERSGLLPVLGTKEFFGSCASFSSSVGGAFRVVCANWVEDQEVMQFRWSSLLTKNFGFRLRAFFGRGAVLEVTVDCPGFCAEVLV